MEDALARTQGKRDRDSLFCVLILVVMEDALALTTMKKFTTMSSS